jgi:hypothetical protein
MFEPVKLSVSGMKLLFRFIISLKLELKICFQSIDLVILLGETLGFLRPSLIFPVFVNDSYNWSNLLWYDIDLFSFSSSLFSSEKSLFLVGCCSRIKLLILLDSLVSFLMGDTEVFFEFW